MAASLERRTIVARPHGQGSSGPPQAWRRIRPRMNPARRRLESLLFFLLVPAASAQDVVLPLPSRVDQILAGGDALARRSEIGKSRTGKPILAVEVASAEGALPPARRPAVLVVA